MLIQSLFSKPIDRPIEGVIKADDNEGLTTEVDEYVITNELEKRLENFLESYNDYQNANGVWISGFFGSGKSHLLKMVSLLLSNQPLDGKPTADRFLPKCKDNKILQGSIRKAVSIPSESILFNIDQKADVISKDQVDALLSVFVKVFDEHCGYWGKQPYIAQLERQLDEDGLLEDFKKEFEKAQGKDWEWGRHRINRVSQNIDIAYQKVTGGTVTNVIDRFKDDYKLSIEDFAENVQSYIDKKGKNFRLNFFVDEAGQYIADNTKLMTNLQTVAESLATKCKGQAWVIVTAQEDMNTVVGELDKQQSNDFSKIQARFANRMKLTSADVSEVIQKRLLEKAESSHKAVLDIYNREHNNFRTLFEFADGGQTYKNYRDSIHFLYCYPFVPYQFDLFQLSIRYLSQQNAFEGKHSSVGERSMLGVFQEVAVHLKDKSLGELATFDLMFEGIRSALKGQIQHSITVAERNLDNELAKKILKALFLVKYVREFKPTITNICVLLTSHFDQDLGQLRKDVEEALNLLEREVYVQRQGDTYEFLTDEEKDVEREIKNTDIEMSDMSDELSSIIFDGIIKRNKLRYEPLKHDFNFTRRLDDRMFGREHELSVHVITPLHEKADQIDELKTTYGTSADLLVVFPSDDRIIRELSMYLQTKKYCSQNSAVVQKEAVRNIITNKQVANQQRMINLKQLVIDALGEARMFAVGNEIESASKEPTARLYDGFERLVTHVYPNLAMLRGIIYTEGHIQSIVDNTDGDMFGDGSDNLAETETEILSFLKRKSNQSLRTTLKDVVDAFEKTPYGWPLPAIQANVAKLLTRGKAEARADSELLDGSKLVTALKNTRSFGNVILEPQVDFTASQVRRLKDFYEQFFDSPARNSEAKSLGKECADEFEHRAIDLESMQSLINDFSFLRDLDEPIQTMKRLSRKGFKYLLTDFEGEADQLLDEKENVIDPITRFIKGSMAGIYRDAQRFLNSNEANFRYLDSKLADELRSILNDPKCYVGSKMQNVKSLHTELQNLIHARLAGESQRAIATLNELKSKLTSLANTEQISDQLKQRIDTEFEEAEVYLRERELIPVVRSYIQEFERDTYHSLLVSIEEELRPTEDKPDDGNEDQKPAQTSIHVRDLKVSYNKTWLQTESDVDEYLAQLKEQLMAEIKDGKKVVV